MVGRGRHAEVREIVHVRRVEVGDAPCADEAVVDGGLQRLDSLLEPVMSAPVVKVEVEAVGVEPVERSFKRPAHARRRGVRGKHFRDEEDVVAPPGDRLSDQLLARAGAVHLGRVDHAQAEVEAAADRGDLRVALAAILAQVPGADADGDVREIHVSSVSDLGTPSQLP